MVGVFLNGKVGIDIKGNMLKMREMAMVRCLGLMVVLTKENGNMEFKMGLA